LREQPVGGRRAFADGVDPFDDLRRLAARGARLRAVAGGGFAEEFGG